MSVAIRVITATRFLVLTSDDKDDLTSAVSPEDGITVIMMRLAMKVLLRCC